MQKFIGAAALAAISIVSAPSAVAATIVTGTNSYNGLGNTPGQMYDMVTLGTKTLSVGSTPAVFDLNSVTFSVNYTYAGAGPFTGSLNNSINIDGQTYNYGVNYSLSVGFSDTITLGGNSFNLGGYSFALNTLTLNAGTGQSATGTLRATVTPPPPVVSAVPEPATWAMMLIGFGAVGASMRRRKTTARIQFT